MLDVDQQLGTVAARAQLDDRCLEGAIPALALGHELDDRLGSLQGLDLHRSRRGANDDCHWAGDRERLAPHRLHPRVPRGFRTRTAGSCFGGRRSPSSST